MTCTQAHVKGEKELECKHAKMPLAATKRLFTQSITDPGGEPTQPDTVVIIHPGSLYLRVGKATDAYPVTLPHCVAWRHKSSEQKLYRDGWLARPECCHSDSSIQQLHGLRQAMEILQSRATSLGESRHPTSNKQLAVHNCTVKGETADEICPQQWTNTESKPKFIIGEEALHVHPSDHYTLHWPWRRGRFNLHSGPGGTMSTVLNDLETIWSAAIQSHLDIPLKDLKHYRAILLIPDVYNHHHVKEMMRLLLENLGFGAAFVHQESVCSAFGSGVSSACVVDVGDQKTSVCCIEDGISQKNTRLTMEYGGCDVSRCFYWLLGRAGFQPKDVALQNTLDNTLIQEIKEANCHMEQDEVGIYDKLVLVKRPQMPIINYSLKLGDEAILAPMSLFVPDMYGLKGSHLAHTQSRYNGDPEDPHDQFYLKHTQSLNLAAKQNAAKKKEAADLNKENLNLDSTSQFDDVQNIQQMDDDSSDAAESLPANEAPVKPKLKIEPEEEPEAEPVNHLMGVDQAIVHSIDKCGIDEVKRKMYSCVLVVGGGMMFEGVQSWLQHRLLLLMPPQIRIGLETMDIVTSPKELDPRFVAWKGATIMACLDTTQELWIHQHEWKEFKVRMLRERSPFIW